MSLIIDDPHRAYEASVALRYWYHFSSCATDWLSHFRLYVLKERPAYDLDADDQTNGALEMLEIYTHELSEKLAPLDVDAVETARHAHEINCEGPQRIFCARGHTCWTAHAYVGHLVDWVREFSPKMLPTDAQALHDHVAPLDVAMVEARLRNEYSNAMQELGLSDPTAELQENHEAIDTSQIEWSKPMPPKEWAKAFECSLSTLKRMRDRGEIRVDAITTKFWRIATDDAKKHAPQLFTK